MLRCGTAGRHVPGGGAISGATAASTAGTGPSHASLNGSETRAGTSDEEVVDPTF